MYKFVKVEDKAEKARITDNILHKLPKWFGNEKSIVEYIQGVQDKFFYAAYDGEKSIGFISLEINNKFTGEIYVFGVLEEYHRRGIGKNLVFKAEQHLRENNYRFMMVKTLGESCDYEPYKKTREFYMNVGFYPLYETAKIWDEENPCLMMVKAI